MTNGIPNSDNVYVNCFNQLLNFYFVERMYQDLSIRNTISYKNWNPLVIGVNLDILITLLILNSKENLEYPNKIFDSNFLESHINFQCKNIPKRDNLTNKQFEEIINNAFDINKNQILEFNKKIKTVLGQKINIKNIKFDFSNFIDYYKQSAPSNIPNNMYSSQLFYDNYNFKSILAEGDFDLQKVNRLNTDLYYYLVNTIEKCIPDAFRDYARNNVWGIVFQFYDQKNKEYVKPNDTFFYIQYLK